MRKFLDLRTLSKYEDQGSSQVLRQRVAVGCDSLKRRGLLKGCVVLLCLWCLWFVENVAQVRFFVTFSAY